MADTRPRVMNFFEHQEKARKRTSLLLLLFILAVTFIIAALYFVTLFLFFYGQSQSNPAHQVPFSLWNPAVLVGVALGTLAFIALASLFKVGKLRGGGASVAVMLGGRLVTRATTDLKEKRLLNVVEEMAIAAGVPVPQVFLLDNESGINAFAAGNSVNDAVVATTAGALDQLNRDELQAVIGHEFSHIFNGDMRLNIHLIGIIFGILALSIIGGHMLYGMRFSRRSKGSGGIMLFGLALVLIGYIGAFFGRMIQAAVSRQREFLADASAVQFTRNPTGLVGAFKKIGGLEKGSTIDNPASRQASHMFFGADRGSWLGFLLATHPPLADRIARIDASFDGDIASQVAAPSSLTAGLDAAVAQFGGGSAVRVEANEVVGKVGTVDQGALDAGVAILSRIPDPVREKMKTPDGARQVVFAILLDTYPDEREKQCGILRPAIGDADTAAVVELAAAVDDLPGHVRLPIVELALPALREFGFEDLSKFVDMVEDLVMADSKLSLFEFGLQWLITHRLQGPRGRAHSRAFANLKPLRDDVALMLMVLATEGQTDDPAAAEKAYWAGTACVRVLSGSPPDFVFQDRPDFQRLGQAMHRVAAAFFEAKQEVIEAFAHCALFDQRITLEEAELLRLFSISLDCPLPQFLPETT
jgi:Zn-dependent protease with chaperone function